MTSKYQVENTELKLYKSDSNRHVKGTGSDTTTSGGIAHAKGRMLDAFLIHSMNGVLVMQFPPCTLIVFVNPALTMVNKVAVRVACCECA